ncbi:MAG: 50S ribosomal protein L10 [Christensenellales bacterium]|jgi:large subunit ribosomal protein L10
MSDNKQIKAASIADIHDRFSRSQSAVLVNYIGLTVAEVTELRNQFRAAGVDFKVYKNTMIRRAAQELGYQGLDEHLNGPTAVAFSYEDPTAGAKIITEYIRKVRKTNVKCGIVNGKYTDAQGVDTLSKIPSREVLLAQLMSVFNGPVRGFAVALKAIAEKQSEAAGVAVEA